MGLLNLFSFFQTIIFLPIITKLLGAENYGIWTQLLITISLIIPLTSLGLQTSLTRFVPSEKNKKEVQEGVYSALILVFFVILLTSLILIVFADRFSLALGFNQIFIKLLSIVVVIEALNAMLLVVVQAVREIGKYFWFSILKMLGETVFVIGAIMLGYGLYGAIIAFLFVRIIIFLFLLLYIFKKIGVKLPDFSLIKKYLAFGLPTVFSNFSYWVVIASDRYLIGFFLGIIFVGYYAPAYSLGTILGFFLFPLSSILSIVLPRLFDENNISEVKKYLSYSLKYYLLIIIPSVFGLSVLSRKLLVIFSTQEIASHSYFITPFITVSIFLYGVSYFFSQVLVLGKKTKTIAGIWMTAAVLNFGFNIAFIPIFGIIAAAVTTLASYLFSFLAMWYFSSKEFKFEIDWVFVLKSILSSILMSLFIIRFNPTGLLKVFVLIALSVGIYAILMLLLNGIKKKEIEFLKNLLGLPFKSKSKI